MMLARIVGTVALLSILGCADSPSVGPIGAKNSKITLYSADGKVIRQWDNVKNAYYTPTNYTFQNSEGRRFYISGTYIVEQ